MKKNKIIGSVMLAVAAFIWGVAFVAQEKGAEHISPMWFVCLRNILGATVLLPVIFFNDRKRKKDNTFKPLNGKKEKKLFWIGAMFCGLSLCVASFFQQLGMTLGTSSGKAGFITALYILMVPIISVFLRKKIRPVIWFCVSIAIVGLYLLCVSENNIQASDFVVLICALCFAIQILIVEHVSSGLDGVKLSAAQFMFAAIFAFIYSVFFEEITIEQIQAGLIPLLYAGICSSGIAFTFQTVGQQRLSNPTVASLIMSFESVFSVLAAAAILRQVPTIKEGIGCVIMFTAIIIAQLPEKKKTAET